MKTPDQMKNLIEEWTTSFGYSVLDTTNQQQPNIPIEWILEIKNSNFSVVVLTDKNSSDILRFQTRINFSPEHQTQTISLSNEEHNSFILDMTDRLAYLGCDWTFIHDPRNAKQINGLAISYFMTYDKTDKNEFLQKINRAFVNQSQMIRAISISLNKGADPTANSGQNSSPSMYG